MRVRQTAPGSSVSRISIRRAALQARLHTFVETLARCGLESDEPVAFQSTRSAFTKLRSLDCSQPDWSTAARVRARTLRTSSKRSRAGRPASTREHAPPGAAPDKPIRAYRARVPDEQLGFVDRAAGRYSQDLKGEVGDFVIRRADGLWAYQLAVVVDDAEQGITDVVRGADLLDNTPRQIFLQRALGLRDAALYARAAGAQRDGRKAIEANGSRAVDSEQPYRNCNPPRSILDSARLKHVGRYVSEASSRVLA